MILAITDKWHPRSDAGPQSQESLLKGDRPITEVSEPCTASPQGWMYQDLIS
jgi:hypothetical protein